METSINNSSNAFSNVPKDSETFGGFPQSSESFGNVPKDSEEFGKVPHTSESFRNVRKSAEKTEHHTLSVREAARLFEQAGVPRTERSIVNWCQSNPQGIARLDAYYDMNERRYLITPQSVARAIGEEQAKQASGSQIPASQILQTSKPESPRSETRPPVSEDVGMTKELERQIRDLEITTRAKDFYIDRLEDDRSKTVEKLVGMSRYVGELETQLLQLGGAPRGDQSLPQGSEAFRNAREDADDNRDTNSFQQRDAANRD